MALWWREREREKRLTCLSQYAFISLLSGVCLLILNCTTEPSCPATLRLMWSFSVFTPSCDKKKQQQCVTVGRITHPHAPECGDFRFFHFQCRCLHPAKPPRWRRRRGFSRTLIRMLFVLLHRRLTITTHYNSLPVLKRLSLPQMR